MSVHPLRPAACAPSILRGNRAMELFSTPSAGRQRSSSTMREFAAA
ncbi:MAG: hypothetical protein MZV70_07620 [Desulfobacterales bacterium]|nr:hypothetical protein [Desulfobacterales bacterium]